MCYSTLPNLSKKIFWSFNMSIDVAIVMGSASDWDVMSNAQKMLDQFGVKAESRVLSAHRTPKELSLIHI